MELYKEGRIKGAFKGWAKDHVFEFTNGEVWKQAKYKYHYHYAYRPDAKIFRDGSQYFLQVEGMEDMVEIKRLPR